MGGTADRSFPVLKIISTAIALALTAAAAVPVSAAPVRDPLVLKNAAPQLADQVQWRRGGWRGGRAWGGAAAGLAAGAIIGGLLARPYGYPYGYGYGYGYPVYGPPVYAAPGYAGGDAVAYCMQRFKSYDPGSGTYLGYDGYRHPCP